MNTIKPISSFPYKMESDRQKLNEGFDINQSAFEKTTSDLAVEYMNKSLEANKLGTKNKLGQNDFLKLLVMQLRFQDPMKPMENKEFIAQMAQFSSLEETTQINKGVQSLLNSYESMGSYNLLGKIVHYRDPLTESVKSGMVTSVSMESGKVVLGINKDKVMPADIVKVELYQSNNAENVNKR